MLGSSLRIRLSVLILLPLIIVSVFAVIWRYYQAQETTEQIFDRTLVAITLAVSRDVLISQGDLLSPSTLELIQDASAGSIFYHVNGPDGTFITGYAYPPRNPQPIDDLESAPVIFDAKLRNEDVRVVQFKERMSFDGISGIATVTVWQDKKARIAFAWDITRRAAALMIVVTLTVAALVWFGIHLGLRPLNELQDAIARRSPDDLSPIRRKIPEEASEIVQTLNSLFVQVSDSIESRNRFISNAAHQLRNPVAAIQTMAEAIFSAKTFKDSKERSRELLKAARYTSRLSHQLLSLERIKGLANRTTFSKLDVAHMVEDVCRKHATSALKREIEFTYKPDLNDIYISGNVLLLSEAIENIIDNALSHGGAKLSSITVETKAIKGHAHILICNNGVPIPQAFHDVIFDRFAQADQTDQIIQNGAGRNSDITEQPRNEGSGLGLSIVSEIIDVHHGTIKMSSNADQTCFDISIPMIKNTDAEA